MSSRISYRALYSVAIYHAYFLDDGINTFLAADTSIQQKRLDEFKYKVNDFLSIVPCERTKSILAGQQIKYVLLNDKLVLLIRTEDNKKTPFIDLHANTHFRFLIYTKDVLFGNYTDLKKPHNSFFFITNKNTTPQNELTLIPLQNSNAPLSEAFLIDKNKFPNAETYKEFLTSFDPKELVGLHAVLELHASREDGQLSLLKGDGNLKDEQPEFMLHFPNRRTLWRYLNADNRSEIFTTQETKPLTKNGKITIEHEQKNYPNPPPNQLFKYV